MAFATTIDRQKGIITLQDSLTGTEADIFIFGGMLNAFRIRMGNGTINVVDGFSSPEEAREHLFERFKGAKLSPFVCRLYEGNYSFEGKEYHITGHFLNGHAIHGLVLSENFRPEAYGNTGDAAFVTLVYDYEGTDTGYPFPYRLQVRWELGKGNTLSVVTNVVHHNSHAIPYTDGWHPYFTLGGDMIDECNLQFDSDRCLEFSEDLIPTGKVFTDARFVNGCSLQGIDLDNSFRMEGGKGHCRLYNDVLEVTVHPDENYPILQLYIQPNRKSLAIENLSGPPDNFNNGIDLLTLMPGEEKIFTTRYSVKLL